MKNLSKCCNAEVRETKGGSYFTHDCEKCGLPCDLVSPEVIENKCIECGNTEHSKGETHRFITDTNKEWDMRDVDDAIMDFQIHVRKVTGGNDYACVDSTELKKAIKGLLSTKEKELKQNIGLLRQYLNERTDTRLLTNEDLEAFLIK